MYFLHASLLDFGADAGQTEDSSYDLGSAAGLATWLTGTCQVGRLVRRPGGPPRQMLK